MQRSRLFFSSALVVLATLMAACELLPDLPVPGGGDVTVALPQSSFSVATDSLYYELHNASADTLHYFGCFATTIEEFDGDEMHASVTLPICTCECPTYLLPGERRLEMVVSSEHWSDFTGGGEGWAEDDSLTVGEGYRYRVRLDISFYENFAASWPNEVVQPGPLYTDWFTIVD